MKGVSDNAGVDKEMLLPAGPSTPEEVLRSFLLMALSFSTSFGAVTGSVALASSVLGSDLGGSGVGTLYLVYTFSAMLIGKPLVRRTGEKRALVLGLSLYSVFLFSFIGAFLCAGDKDGQDSSDDGSQPLCSWVIFNGGSAVGGFAAGFYWTAQGSYYSGAAELWAKGKGVAPEVGNAKFAGIFATVFLTLELAVKAGTYGILQNWGDNHTGRLITFGAYCAVTVVAGIGMSSVRPLDELRGVDATAGERETKGLCTDAAASGRLLFSDPRMALLVPVNLAFGFTQALINNVVYADIVKPNLGAAAVPLLSGGICGIAAMVSMPLSWVAAAYGGAIVVFVGMMMFAGQGVVYMQVSFDSLGHWAIISGLLAAQAVGRAAWEGSNRAVVADYFASDRPAAFSNVVLQSGGAASIGFYLFPKLSHWWVAAVCVASAGAALITVPVAGFLQRRRLAKAAEPKGRSEVEGDGGEPGDAVSVQHRQSISFSNNPDSPAASGSTEYYSSGIDGEPPSPPKLIRSASAVAAFGFTPGGVLSASLPPADQRSLHD
eukprot:Hpha_TRINITY_DN12929_c0_g2::TRINITY_DN12929_c0_g2_i1::g.164600::m.164600